MIDGNTLAAALAGCLAVQGFSVSAESALSACNRGRLRQKAQAGNLRAKLAESLVARPQVALATTLLVANLAWLCAVLVSALWLRGRGSPMVIAVAVVPPMLVLGQLVPRALSQAFADRVVLLIAPFLAVLSWVVRPAAWVVSGFAAAMTRMLGTDKGRTFVTRDELTLLIEGEAKADDTDITADEREMIANVLELSEYSVRDLMVPLSEVTALDEDSPLGEVATEVADKRHSRLPVYRGRVDDIVGIIHVFDVLQAGAERRAEPVSAVARPAVYVPESMKATELLVQLQAEGQHIAVVVDEYGGAVGIVTVEDLLETIVGEIDDEYDDEPSPIRAERPGVWRIEARTAVERVNHELDVGLPESDEYETLAGLLIEHFRRIPDPGEKMTVGAVDLEVMAASDRAVEMVRLTRRRK